MAVRRRGNTFAPGEVASIGGQAQRPQMPRRPQGMSASGPASVAVPPRPLTVTPGIESGQGQMGPMTIAPFLGLESQPDETFGMGEGFGMGDVVPPRQEPGQVPQDVVLRLLKLMGKL